MAQLKVISSGMAASRKQISELLDEARKRKAVADAKGAKMTAAVEVGRISAYEDVLAILHQ